MSKIDVADVTHASGRDKSQLIERAPLISPSLKRNSSSTLETGGFETIAPDVRVSADMRMSRRQLFVLISCWYTTSIIATKLNYAVMDELGSALYLSLFQQIFVVVVGFFSLFLNKQRTPTKLSLMDCFRVVLPLSLTMAILSVSYNMAMFFIPVSFLNTIKSTIPLWTCLICWFIKGEHFALATKLSLLPIVFGVGLASCTEIGFDTIGFALACLSAINQTMFNIRAKEVIALGDLSNLEVQFYTATISSLVLGCFSLVTILLPHPPEANDIEIVVEDDAFHSYGIFALLLLCGVNYFLELRFGYTVIESLRSLGYSIADVLRRLVVIISSVILFGNPVTFLNVMGVMIAMAGITLYNYTTVLSDQTPSPPKRKKDPPVRKTRPIAYIPKK